MEIKICLLRRTASPQKSHLDRESNMLFQLQKRGGRGIGLNPWLELIREQGGRGLHPIAKKSNNKVSMGFGLKSESRLDRVSTGSDSDLVRPWESRIIRNIAC